MASTATTTPAVPRFMRRRMELIKEIAALAEELDASLTRVEARLSKQELG